MRRNDQQTPRNQRASFTLFPGSSAIALPVYREFVDMLYSMWLPIFGLGCVFVAACILAAFQLAQPMYLVLGIVGALTIFLRLWAVRAYWRVSPVGTLADLRRWEWRYAIGNYVSAAQLALLNIMLLTVHDPWLQLIAVSLLFSFGAGIVARTSVRPQVCVISLLIATLPTVAALVFHAFNPHAGSDGFYTEMLLIEALLVAMITGLSLQTVAHLYRTAVEHHTAKHDLAQLAKYDALTGLANRLLLRERFQLAITDATRRGQMIAVHFLDLDGFKAVNDACGHPVGDALLEQVARRLETMVRAEDTVARLGGDEFVVLQVGLEQEDEAKMLARRFIRQLSLPYGVDDSIRGVSVSVGIATAPKQGVELEGLLACADAALYRAKASGKARAIFCTREENVKGNLAA